MPKRNIVLLGVRLWPHCIASGQKPRSNPCSAFKSYQAHSGAPPRNSNGGQPWSNGETAAAPARGLALLVHWSALVKQDILLPWLIPSVIYCFILLPTCAPSSYLTPVLCYTTSVCYIHPGEKENLDPRGDGYDPTDLTLKLIHNFSFH